MYIGIFATVIAILIAIYLGTKKKEPEIATKDLVKKDKVFFAEEIKVKEPEKNYNLNQDQSQGQVKEENQLEFNQSEPEQSESDSEPPFRSPSEPEVL